MERRRTVRYNLCLPLIFEWTDQNGTVIQEAGFTRDVSTSGVYVSCVNSPPINSILRLQIALPPNKQVLPDGLRLNVAAEVLRFATDGEVAGFAAVGELATGDRNSKRQIHVVDKPASL
jgi:PilZ domain-containing protein